MQENIQPDVKDYIEIFLKRKWFFIVPFTVIFFSSIAASFFMPKKYESSCVILVEAQQIIDPLIKNIAISPDVREQINTLKTQILTWPRLVELVNKMKLAKDITNQLDFEKFILNFKDQIDIQMKKDLVYVSFRGKDPYTVKEITTNISQMFIDENAQFKSEGAKSAIDFIEKQLNMYGKKLEESGKDLSKYKVQAELDEVKKEAALVKKQLSNHEEVVVSMVKTEQNPTIIHLNNRLAALETQLAQLMVDAKEDHPLVVELSRDRENVKATIAKEMQKTIISSETKEANPIYQNLLRRLRELDLKQSDLEQRLREIKKDGMGKFKKGSISNQELLSLDRDSRVNEDMYAILLQRLETARISMELEAAEKGKKFRIIEPARLPLKPVSPNKKKIALLGLMLGFGVGGGLIFFLDYMDHSFKKIEDAKAFLNIPYLGVTSKIVIGSDFQNKES